MGYEEIKAGKLKDIDVDALFKVIASISTTGSISFSRGAYIVAQQVLEFVKNSPAVETVKHGKWELDRNKGYVCCTQCGGERPLRYKDGGTFHKENFQSPYCPYCGAKMDDE